MSAQKTTKVYCVQTAILSDEDSSNWAEYNVIAEDAESAIVAATLKFDDKREYAEQVTLICVLD